MKNFLFNLLFAIFSIQYLLAATLPDGFTEERLATRLDPTGVTAMADGRVLVTIKSGRVLLIKDNMLQTTPFLVIPNVDNWNERGLLCVVEDPDFETNGYIYVYYTYKNGNVSNNRVSRFTVTGDEADPGSQLVLINFNNLSRVGWHNGGGLVFGADGKLYASSGENANTSFAQSMSTLLGKVIRINKDGTIPEDNPFYNTTTGNNRAIYAIGFRNPFRLKFQPGSGKIYINDVGSGRFEEINELIAGGNYGWPGIEGTRRNQTAPANYQDPIYAYGHSGNICSITGGAAYSPETNSFPAVYKDKYFFMDYCAGWIRYIDPANDYAVGNFASGIDRPLDMAVSKDGSLYYLSRGGIGGGSDADNTSSNEGELWRVSYSGSNDISINVHPADRSVAIGTSVSFTVSATGAVPITYQWQRNGQDIADATTATYNIPSASLADHDAEFRVVVSNRSSTITSTVATLSVFNNTAPTAAILTPDETQLYSAGTEISFSGTGTDAEDGDLPASAYTWYVHFHHDTHYHPSMDPVSGIKSGTFLIPDEGETSDTVWYRIYLTVTDSLGTKTTVFKEIHPQKVQVTLNTQPQGLPLKIDGNAIVTPFTFTGVVGLKRILEAENMQVIENNIYGFGNWSNNETSVHTITTPAENTTYTATYLLSKTDTLEAVGDAYVKGGSNADSTYGSLDPLQLQTKSESVSERVRYSYLKFDISNTPSVTGATLRLFGKRNSVQNENVKVAVSGLSESAWDENTITWNNKPNPDTVFLEIVDVNAAPTAAGQYYDWDVSSYVTEAKKAGANSVSFFLSNPEITETYIMFNSKEASSNNPQLVITTPDIAASVIKNTYIEAMVYPNPFADHFWLIEEGAFSYTISDISGAVLLQGQSYGNTRIEKNLTRGMYIIHIQKPDSYKSAKITKF